MPITIPKLITKVLEKIDFQENETFFKLMSFGIHIVPDTKLCSQLNGLCFKGNYTASFPFLGFGFFILMFILVYSWSKENNVFGRRWYSTTLTAIASSMLSLSILYIMISILK